MEKNIITLSKWLISKGVESPLRLQKILFFIRYEELKANNLKNSYFKSDRNFQAWIYGPVNKDSYDFFKDYFSKSNESEEFHLDDKEIKLIDKQYETYFEKYDELSNTELVDKSHKNKAWKNARGDKSEKDVCTKELVENDDFLIFE